MTVLVAYTVYQFQRYLRTPMTLGWLFVFPIVLLLLFGGMHKQRLVGEKSAMAVAVDGELLSEHDASFLMMGLVGLTVASAAIFGLGVVLVQAREQGILRRLRLTPQPVLTFIGGQILASGAIVMLSALLLLSVGGLVFQARLPGRLVEWFGVLVMGSLSLLAIGYALAASMRDVRTAQIVGNTVFVFVMLLGGVWFPVADLPTYIAWLGYVLPLSHFVTLLRVVGYQGQPLGDHLSSLAMLAFWGGGALAVARSQFHRIGRI